MVVVKIEGVRVADLACSDLCQCKNCLNKNGVDGITENEDGDTFQNVDPYDNSEELSDSINGNDCEEEM